MAHNKINYMKRTFKLVFLITILTLGASFALGVQNPKHAVYPFLVLGAIIVFYLVQRFVEDSFFAGGGLFAVDPGRKPLDLEVRRAERDEKDKIIDEHVFILFVSKQLSAEFEKKLAKNTLEYDIIKSDLLKVSVYKFQSLLEQMTAKQILNHLQRDTQEFNMMR